LLRHLDLFLSADEVRRLRDDWVTLPGVRKRSARSQLGRLTAVVRALARERVPLTDGAALLAAAATVGTIDEATDAYRRTAACPLPGSEPDTVRVTVPPRLAALAEDPQPGGLGLFAALAELRAVLAAQPAPMALVAADSASRRAVRGFLRGEFPDLPVLSAEEASRVPAAARPSLSEIPVGTVP
jgi:flagellar biosynthesis component FlhA